MGSSDKKQRYTVLAGVAGVVVVAVIAGTVVYATGSKDGPPAGESSDAKDRFPFEDSSDRPEAAGCELQTSFDSDGGALETTELPAVSPSGDYIVWETASGATLWKGYKSQGALEDHNDLSLDNINPASVNSSGVVVGSGVKGDITTSWRYQDGKMSELKPPEGFGSQAPGAPFEPTGINDEGEVVGYASDEGRIVAVKWEAGSRTAVELESSEDETEAVDIHDDGTVVGYARKDESSQPWMWDSDGEGEKMSSPGGVTKPKEIRGDWTLLKDDDGGTYRWNLSDEDDPEKIDGTASVIDTEGRAYGVVDNHPVRIGDEGTDKLPMPRGEPEDSDPSAEGEPDVNRFSVRSVSDDGKVVLGAASTGGPEEPSQNKGMMWKCE